MMNHILKRPQLMRRSFSLVEMMAVLIVVGLLLAAVMGSFNGIAKGNNVDSAARMVSSQLFLARSYAVSQRRHVAVVFATDKSAVSTWLCDSGGACSGFVPNTQWNYVATGAQADVVSGEATVSGITGLVPATKAIIFKPNGSTTNTANATVSVGSETVAANKLSMTVNWLTGRVSFPE